MEPTRVDILIGRVIDAEASPADWGELEALAATDPAVWTRLATAQREHARLERTVDDALTVAELVDAPDPTRYTPSRWTEISVRWRAYSGWAAAAVIALVWASVSGVLPSNAPRHDSTQLGGLPVGLGADDIFQRYVDSGRREGRVLGELPMVMVESRPLASGAGAEVIYLRQILERVEVRGVYEVGANEHGEPAIMPSPTATFVRNDPI